MGAIASLGQSALAVEPGGQVVAAVRVRNTGDVVDQFHFEVIGDAAAWTTVDPPVLRLLPDAEEEVQVTFQPPRSADVTTGPVPFAVKVVSQEDPAGTVVEEGTLDVGAFAEVTAELIPRTVRGRGKATQDLAVDNRGNRRVDTEVIATDEQEALTFALDEPTIVVEPGHATFARLTVRPRERFWRGAERTHPYRLQLPIHEGEPPVEVDGTLVQQPMLPRWLPKALLALVGLLILLAVLWFTLLRPAIESAAQGAVEEPLAEQAQRTDALQDAVADVQEQVGDGAGGDDDDDADEGDGPSAVRVRTARDFTLAVSQTPQGEQVATSGSVTPEGDDRLEITDIILQNPEGNEGLLRVRRGTDILLQVALQNFRDLDYHFVGPLAFTSDAGVNIQIVCQDVIEPSTECSASALFSGRTVSRVE